MRKTILLFMIFLGLISVYRFVSEAETVIRWQAEGIAAFNAWTVSIWQEWWRWDPYEIAVYCWSSITSWLQIAATLISIVGLWRNK